MPSPGRLRYADLTIDLTAALSAFEKMRPYSTSPHSKGYEKALRLLGDLEELLYAMEKVKPGMLRLLESEAEEFLEPEHQDDIPAITALVKRYARLA